MAIKVNLFAFNKKDNSTAIPSGTGTEYDCNLKSYTSVTNPVITISRGNISLTYNYAYISSFHRYYFIEDIRYELGVWAVYLKCDVLGSYRTDIRSSSQYVLRSASDSDGTIVDNMYSTKATSTKGKSYGTAPIINAGTGVSSYFDGIISTGCFVVQVISNNTNGVTAYAMNNSAFVSLLTNLFNYFPSDMSDVSSGVGKALYDPIQYITSVKWYPNFPDKAGGTNVSSIKFAGYSISVSGTCKAFDPSAWDDIWTDIVVQKHPDSSSYPYTQLSPFSNYLLYFEPFGVIPLDTTKLYGVSKVRVHWYLEYQKGMAHMEVVDYSDSTNLIASASAVFGIDLPITQLTVDYLGAVSSIVSGGVGASLDLLTGNVVGAISNGLTAIGNGINSMMPTVESKGTAGSFLIFRGETPRIHYQFMNILDRDNTHFGSPLCKVKTLSSLSGYLVCQNAEVSFSSDYPTSQEAQRVNDYLNTGIYME